MKRASLSVLAIILLISMLCSCASNNTGKLSAEGQTLEQELSWQEQYDLGVRYLSEGNYEEAIIAFTAAIEIDARHPEVFLSRANAYIAAGETEGNLAAAEGDYLAALELDEMLADAYIGLIDIYIAAADFDSAGEFLELGQQAFESSVIPDIFEEAEQRILNAMVENEDYSFMYSGDLENIFETILSGWKVNGTPIAESTLADWQAAYPDESSYGLQSYVGMVFVREANITRYQPMIDQGNSVSASNVEVIFEDEAVFQASLYGENERQTYARYWQPDFYGITTSDSFEEVLKKLGFTESGIQYVLSPESGQQVIYIDHYDTEYGESGTVGVRWDGETRISFGRNENGDRYITFDIMLNNEMGQIVHSPRLSIVCLGDQISDIYYQSKSAIGQEE